MVNRIGAGALLAGLLVLVPACGSDSSPTEDRGEASISATINGVAWSVSAPFASSQHNAGGGIFTLTAVDPAQSYGLAITLSEFTGSGTYEIRAGFPLRMAVVTVGAGTGWGTEYSEVPGTISITSFGNDRARGTFSFTAEPSPSSEQTGTLTVVNGQFDVPVIPVG